MVPAGSPFPALSTIAAFPAFMFLACLLALSAPVTALAEPLPSPLNRATELTRQGENLGLEQKVDDASAAFNQASGLYEKLLDQNPGDVVCRQGLASCYEKFGDMLVANNCLDQAFSDYQKGLTIRQALATQAPEDPDRSQALVESLARMGRASLLQHRLSDSLQFYRLACSTGDRLAKHKPQNYCWVRELAIDQGWVGEILLLLRSYDEAADAFALIVDTVKLSPSLGNSDLSWLTELAANVDDAAGLILTKKPEQALRIFEAAKDLRQQLVASGADNTDFKRDLAIDLVNIASLLLAGNEAQEASSVCQGTVELLNSIDAGFADGSKTQLALGRVLEAYGLAAEQLHRDDEALSHFNQSAAILERAHAKLPSDFGVTELLCRVLSRCGSLLIADRRYTDALDVYERAHKMLNTAYQADPSDPSVGTELIVDLEAIGYVFSVQKMPTPALSSYKAAGAILMELRQLHPESHELEETFAGTELALGKLLREQGKATDARAAFEQCSEILFHLSETGHLDDQGANWLHEADTQLRQPF
jgi:tetratricopeptide (TPR) repeat protein